MKKIYIAIVLMAIVSICYGQWDVYTCDFLPDAAGFTVPSSGNAPGPDLSETIEEIDGFTVLNFYSPNSFDPSGEEDDARKAYEKTFESLVNKLTIVIRAKGYSQADWLNDSIDAILEVEIQPGEEGVTSYRDKLEVHYVDTVGGYYADAELIRVGEIYDLEDGEAWHTYRITADIGETSGTFSLYIDEDPEAVISGESTKDHENNYFRFGDRKRMHVGGYIDWIAWFPGGAYAPGEGTPLPDNIFVDGRDWPASVSSTNRPIVKIYPNPVSKFLKIRTNRPNSEVSLFDLTGRQIMHEVMKSREATYSLNGIPSGLYVISVRNESGIHTEQLIVK